MLRITDATLANDTGAPRIAGAQRQAAEERTLRIEGSLTSATVPTLCAACRDTLGASGALALDLAGVTFVDAGGAACLHRLRERGVAFRRTNPFVTALLERQRREGR